MTVDKTRFLIVGGGVTGLAHPGLGRYAESLGRALLKTHGESLSLFYYGDAGLQPPTGLEDVPRIIDAVLATLRPSP